MMGDTLSDVVVKLAEDKALYADMEYPPVLMAKLDIEIKKLDALRAEFDAFGLLGLVPDA